MSKKLKRNLLFTSAGAVIGFGASWLYMNLGST